MKKTIHRGLCLVMLGMGMTGAWVGSPESLGVLAQALAETAVTVPIPAPAPPESPRLISQSFADWVYRCQEAMEDGKPAHSQCELAQDVIVHQDDKTLPVMTIAFAQGQEPKGHVVTILVPLGVRLKPGLGVAADEGAAQPFAFDYCGQRGCWVSGAPADALIRAFKAGKTGRAKLVLVNGRDLTIEFPLTGLATGLAALDSTPQPPEKTAAKPKTD